MVDYILRYYFDDWSNTGPSYYMRHQIQFRSLSDDSWIDLQARAFDSWGFEMIDWCDNNMGVTNDIWQYSRTNSTFYFRDMEDAMAFKLRWS